MKDYNRHGAKRGSMSGAWKSHVGTAIVIAGLVALFIFGVYQFRTEELEVSDAPEKPTPDIVMTDENNEEAEKEPSTRNDETVLHREISLQDVQGTGGTGTATRGTKDGRFFHTVKAILPEIDRDAYFYEGWLVRKVPFHFFSTGEMVTNEEGVFVLEWEGEEGGDYDDYTDVVITLEPRDGDPSPDDHVLEGTFRD